jgi:uncharacterized protein YegL
MPENFISNDAAYTEQYYSQLQRVTESGNARMLLCFCIDISQSMNLILDGYREGRDYRYVSNYGRSEDGVSNVRSVEALPGRVLLNRLAKLTDILCKMINDLKRQRDIADSVAICITTFSQYADVIQDFQDLRDIRETYISRRLQLGTDSTNMAKGLAFAEREIKNQQDILDRAQIDTYTPMLVVMSDGLPTDGIEADRKREAIRAQSDDSRLNVIPVFIGGNDDHTSQRFLKGMNRDEILYTMSADNEYDRVFEIVRNAIFSYTRYTVTDMPEKMAQHVVTETQTALDTTYGMPAINILGGNVQIISSASGSSISQQNSPSISANGGVTLDQLMEE